MDNALSNYMCYRPKRSTVKVEWEWIGEGYVGDYIPNTDDEKLLRFTVLLKNKNKFEQVASYCTTMSTTTNKPILRMMLKYIYDKVVGDVRSGIPIKSKAQHLSWIEPSWLYTTASRS